MGRGSSNGGGSSRLNAGAAGGMGATKSNGIENGMMVAGGATQAKVNNIVDSVKPDSSGLVSSDTMKKAGSDLNKMMEVGDQFEITFADGSKKTYEKISSNSFQSGQFTYKSVQLGNEIAAYKYPNPNLKANKITAEIKYKLSQAQQKAADSIANKVKKGNGTGLDFVIYPDRNIGFSYKRNGTMVLGSISKDGKARIAQTYNPNFG